MNDQPGVYGKHPGQADFVHAGSGVFVQAGLDGWFEEATETLRRERLVLPEALAAFMLVPAGTDVAFAGAFAPSEDAVGRKFPLIVFAVVRDSFPTASALYACSAPFARAAFALLAGAATLPVEEVVARAQALAPPRPVPGGAPLDHEPAEAIHAALGGTPGALAYALRTWLAAADQAAKAAGTGGPVVTVDAPAPSEAARGFWLDLVASRLGGVVPSLLWTAGPSGRLLAAFGPPPVALLPYLANPQHRATRFWPLRTDAAAAIDGALKALSPEQKRLVEDPSASLASLLAAFG
jgi:type VI secretion system ImpM family protein